MLFPETLDRIYIFANRPLFSATRFNFVYFLPFFFFFLSYFFSRLRESILAIRRRVTRITSVKRTFEPLRHRQSRPLRTGSYFERNIRYQPPNVVASGPVIETILDVTVFITFLLDSYRQVLDERMSTFLILHGDDYKP